MTATRVKSGFAFECDSCGEAFEPPQLGRGSASRTFSESLEDAKEEGWVARKSRTDKEWKHYCSRCKDTNG